MQGEQDGAEDPLEALKKRKAAASADTTDPLEALKRRKAETSEAPKITVEPAGVIDRALSGVGSAIGQFVNHPLDTIGSLVAAPVKSAFDAVVTPEIGEARHDPRLSKGGNASGRPIDTTPYDREHGAISREERNAAGVQTLANIAIPKVASGVAGRLGGGALARLAGTAAGGGIAGAAYTPDDPAAGALTGVFLAPLLHGATKGAGKLATGAANVGDLALDVVGKRPETTRPLVSIAGRSFGSLEGVKDRASRLNAEKLTELAPYAGDRPMAPVDLGGTPAQRLARGLKTSSPAAEQVFRDALHPRAEGAVERVIQHGLETTGLVNRESGLQVVDDLIAQRAQHGNQNYQPIFQKYSQPLDNPEFNRIINTPSGQQALRRGAAIAADRGESIGRVTEMVDAPAPPGYSPEQWEKVKRAAAAQGVEIPQVEGPSHLAPTLQQAHFIKLGFDDMLASAPEPGSGGSGPNRAAGVRALKNAWLKAMDSEAPEYGDARKVFADESDLVRAGKLGQKLFSMHPDEAAKAFADMSEAERDVARRTGFDALAERVENGPKDVERGVSKPRDQKRIRLLFPDDASYDQFKQGLADEARMHATTQGVLGGSNTADKLADMAGMVGVSLPDIFKAARGNPLPLVTKAGYAAVRKAGASSLDRLAAERARQLVAGANGDRGAFSETLRQMGRGPQAPAVTTPADRRPPAMRMLPPGRFPESDLQGSAMPIPQPLPKNRRLGPGVTYPPVLGDVPHGTAMPIRQPLPMNRRLGSGGPAAVPTEDVRTGPGIPMPGRSLEDVIREAAVQRYRQDPMRAITYTPAEHSELLNRMRDAVTRGHDPATVPMPTTEDWWRDADAGPQAATVERARTGSGRLMSNLTKASDEQLAGEYAELVDANAQENIAPTALQDESGGGPAYVGKKRGAAHATGRVNQRKLSIAKIEAELARRGIDPIDAYRRARGLTEEGEGDTSFDFGANVE